MVQDGGRKEETREKEQHKGKTGEMRKRRSRWEKRPTEGEDT